MWRSLSYEFQRDLFGYFICHGCSFLGSGGDLQTQTWDFCVTPLMWRFCVVDVILNVGLMWYQQDPRQMAEYDLYEGLHVVDYCTCTLLESVWGQHLGWLWNAAVILRLRQCWYSRTDNLVLCWCCVCRSRKTHLSWAQVKFDQPIAKPEHTLKKKCK